MKQTGISLLEVLVATTIMATIATLSFGALDVSERSKTISEEKMQDLQQFDRGWVMLENDLRNALAVKGPGLDGGFGGVVWSMSITYSGDYALLFFRGGRANPLNMPRTELARVGYRLADGVLWRDMWDRPFNPDKEYAREQKVIDGVEDMKIRALPPGAKGYKEGPWLEEWGDSAQGAFSPDVLPIAIEITIETKNRGEITRLFSLVPGSMDRPKGAP